MEFAVNEVSFSSLLALIAFFELVDVRTEASKSFVYPVALVSVATVELHLAIAIFSAVFGEIANVQVAISKLFLTMAMSLVVQPIAVVISL